MATFYDLPEDAVREILINLDYKSVLAHCSSDKLADKICRKQEFWWQYINSLFHAEYQDFLLYLARERYDLYPFLRRLIKYNFRIIDMLTLYFIWIYALERQEITKENIDDFITYLRNKGELRQQNLKYNKGWRYVFDDRTVEGLKIVWDLPDMIKNNLSINKIELDSDKYSDLDLYLAIIPRNYVGEYLSKNLTVKELAAYLKNIWKGHRGLIEGHDRYVSDIIIYSIGEYWQETSNLSNIKNFSKLTGYILSGEYSFYPQYTRKAVNEERLSGFELESPIHNFDQIIHLLKNKRIFPDDVLESPGLGKYPEEYFDLVKTYYKEKELSELYAKMAPLFEEYGYTAASEIAYEMSILAALPEVPSVKGPAGIDKK